MASNSIEAQNYQWAKTLGGTESQQAGFINIDSLGNIFVIGRFEDTVDFDPGPGVFSLIGSDLPGDLFIAKYDSLGGFLWAKELNCGYLTSYKGTLDLNGNILLTGYVYGDIDLDPGPSYAYYNNPNSAFIVKLDNDGNYLWGGMTSGGMCAGDAITTDVLGNVYYSGTFKNYTSVPIDFDPGPGTDYVYPPNQPSGPSYEGFITKLDPLGNYIWTKTIGQNALDDNIASLAVDAVGNVYSIGGYGLNCDFDPGPATYTLASSVSETFILKLDAAGNFIWVKSIHVGGKVIKSTRTGILHLSGVYTNTVDFDPGAGVASLASNGKTDSFVLKLDSSGAFVWVRSVGGTEYDWVNTIFIDDLQNVFAAGSYSGTADFDPGPGTYTLSCTEYCGGFVFKLNSSGQFIFAKSLEGDSSEFTLTSPETITVNKSNNVFLTGYFWGTIDFDPDAGVQNFSSTKYDAFILKLGACESELNQTSAFHSICAGESATLHATGAYNYTWMPGNFTTDSIVVNPRSSTIYTVTGPKSSDCIGSSLFLLIVDPCTGIKNLSPEENSVLVFPNPNSGSFTVKAEEPMVLRVVNELGQTIQKIELNEKNNFQEQIKIEGSGVFFLVSNNIYKKIVSLH